MACHFSNSKMKRKLSIMVHIYNPYTWKGKARIQGQSRIHSEFKASLFSRNDKLSQKGGDGGGKRGGGQCMRENKNVRQALWHVPIILATQEAKLRGSFEPSNWQTSLDNIQYPVSKMQTTKSHLQFWLINPHQESEQ